MFILDLDEVNAAEINLDAVRSAIEFLEQDPANAGVFANSEGLYYDLWALRHRLRCPVDIWEELVDYVFTHRVSDEQAYRKTFAKRIFSLSKNEPPLEVDSAFGGLGIYKISSMLRNKRHYVGNKIKFIPGITSESTANRTRQFGWQCSEHVSFNAGFRELGKKLFVLPYFINCRIEQMPVHPSAWREKLFDATLIPKETFDPRNQSSSGKVARNQSCPCGSGLRYKHCHGKYA